MIDLGTVRPGATIRIPFSSFDKDDGSAITMTNFAASDILVYKDGSTTERASTSGFTATTDFDAKTGKHLAIIDLADNTTAGFWSAGSEYLVAIDSVTIDSVNTGGWIARFRIGYPSAMLDTTIASLSSQTSFTLTAGPAEDDALNGMWAIIHDIASAVQLARVLVLDYTGSTKTVTLAAGATFTAAAGDNFSLMDMAPLQPATLGRTLVVDASGLADANTVKIGPTGSGTAQTARDVGASVLLSAGTGTGQLDFTSGVVKANVTQFGGSNGTFASGRPEVNVSHFGGTAGTFASGRPEVNLTHIAGTAWASTTLFTLASHDPGATIGTSTLTQAQVSGGAYALNSASFAFNSGLDFTTTQKAATLARVTLTDTVTSYTGNTPQTGDAYARLGAPAGASVSADVAAIKTDTGNLVTRITSTLFSGITSLAQWLGLLAGKQTGNSTARTELRATGAGSGTFDETTDSAEALRDRGDAAWTTATGFSTLDAAGVRTAVGLASANLDTQLDALPTNAELATALGTADDATLAAIAALSIPSAGTIADAVWDEALAGHATGGSAGAALSAANAPTAAAVADAVWDEAIAGHAISGSTGEALAAAGGAGDPWITALPGSYSAGQAGYIVGTNLNATVSSRATQTSVDTVDDFLDTEIAAIKAKTDNLPAAPAAVGDIPTATQNADALLKRDWTSVTGEAARSALNALRFLRNKWTLTGTTLSVKEEDDTTEAWTAEVSTTPGADPITGSDPA